MKKFYGFALSMVLGVGLLTGCGSAYDADESTIYLLNKGKLVVTSVEDFDTTEYNESELKTYVDEMVADYCDSNGKDAVKLKKLKISDEKATMIMEYASLDDYLAFDGEPIFIGTVAEAQEAGYTFEGDFGAWSKEGVSLCGADEFWGSSSLKVLILNKPVDVSLKGKIAYVSMSNVTVSDAHHASLGVPAQETAEEEIGSEMVDTEDATEVVYEIEGTSADDGSVSEDDLLNMAEESEQTETYDFEDEASGEASDEYFYIIYKE